MAGSVFEARSTQTRTSGGSSETPQKAIRVRPRGLCSASKAVTTVTPAGKLESSSR